MKPRKPNQQELEDLTNYLETLHWYDLEDAEATVRDAVKKAAIAVFDDYITDNEGYSGRLMTVVWNIGPELYEVFIWQDGELIHVDQDDNLKE